MICTICKLPKEHFYRQEVRCLDCRRKQTRAWAVSEAGRASRRRRNRRYMETQKGKESMRRRVKKYQGTEGGKATEAKRGEKRKDKRARARLAAKLKRLRPLGSTEP